MNSFKSIGAMAFSIIFVLLFFVIFVASIVSIRNSCVSDFHQYDKVSDDIYIDTENNIIKRVSFFD